jgi:hypothetical protein
MTFDERKRLVQEISVHETCGFLEICCLELDFGEGTWKIGIVNRLVKAVSSQRIEPITLDFSSHLVRFRYCSYPGRQEAQGAKFATVSRTESFQRYG